MSQRRKTDEDRIREFVLSMAESTASQVVVLHRALRPLGTGEQERLEIVGTVKGARRNAIVLAAYHMLDIAEAESDDDDSDDDWGRGDESRPAPGGAGPGGLPAVVE